MTAWIKACATGVVAALLLAGCTTGEVTSTDGATVPVANAGSEGVAATVAVVEGELAYADLGLVSADLDVDVAAGTRIALTDGASASGAGYTVAGDAVTITAGGTYVLSGTLSAGRVVVDADDAVVTLVLDGVDITSPGTGALWVAQAEQVVVYLAEGSVNVLADAQDAVVDEASEDTPTGTLFSADDLWIAGEGTLRVTGVANDGIVAKDSLVIASGVIEVTSADDGIRGKDHLVILDGVVTVTAADQGLKSDNEDVVTDPDATAGVVWIQGGTVTVTTESGDAINAVRQVTIAGGDLVLSAGDDGIHADGLLRISAGSVEVTRSYEGLEASVMLLSGGEARVTASDDGINVAGGVGEGDSTEDASGDMAAPDEGRQGFGPGGGGRPGGVGDGGGMAGDSLADSRYVLISGGTWLVDALGDGIDVNGAATQTGGTVVVTGPSENMNGALDADRGYTLEAGVLAASGSSGMFVTPTSTGDQGVLTLTFSSQVPAGSVISIADASGTVVASLTTARASQALVLSSPSVKTGETYTVLSGGDVRGDATGALVLGGTLAGAVELGTLQAG